jgi:hypothetical protein
MSLDLYGNPGAGIHSQTESHASRKFKKTDEDYDPAYRRHMECVTPDGTKAKTLTQQMMNFIAELELQPLDKRFTFEVTIEEVSKP